ncbi:GrpB family protein [Candidatus Bathyarchaeota archaeon]|nr:GrpB family protein [Candidatus Bathyarchaeota archaeon]
MPAPIIIYPYNPRWSELYLNEEKIILKTLGIRVKSISHIGSTSVSGLPSKDIIDIIVGVESKQVADECQTILFNVGYTDVTVEDSLEWFYCLGKKLEGAYCHLHLVIDGSTHHQNHIIFRDYLRNHPEAIKEYSDLKYSLATQYRNDRVAYTNSKTAFIEKIIRLAKQQ